jgi:hypothetical protein
MFEKLTSTEMHAINFHTPSHTRFTRGYDAVVNFTTPHFDSATLSQSRVVSVK